MIDGKHFVLKYNFGAIEPGTLSYREFFDAVISDYRERVRDIRLAMLDLPPDERNWEQIEAREEETRFFEVHDENERGELLHRTVLSIGEDQSIMRIVDLVRL
jgi:hypothetical protein